MDALEQIPCNSWSSLSLSLFFHSSYFLCIVCDIAGWWFNCCCPSFSMLFLSPRLAPCSLLFRDDLYYCTCTRTTRFMGFDVSSRAGRIIMIAPRSCAPAPPAVLCSLLRKRHEFFFQSCWREMELDNSATFEKKIKSKKLSERYTQMYYTYMPFVCSSLCGFSSLLVFSRVIWSANAPHANEPLICDQQHPHYKGDVYIYAHTPFFLLENV